MNGENEIPTSCDIVFIDIKQECLTDILEDHNIFEVKEINENDSFFSNPITDNLVFTDSVTGVKKPFIIEESSKLWHDFVCHYCQRTFKAKSGIEKHIQLHISENSFKCATCNAVFVTKSYLRKHALLHVIDRNFPCYLCGLRFECKWNLDKHLAIHNPNIVFPCQTCHRKFKRKYKLKSHLEEGCKSLNNKKQIPVIDSQKPFQCDVCKVTFTMRHNLARHKFDIHGSPGKFFACKLCDRTYQRKFDLRRHVDYVHNKRREDVCCTLCNKKFPHLRLLKQHIKRHSKHCILTEAMRRAV